MLSKKQSAQGSLLARKQRFWTLERLDGILREWNLDDERPALLLHWGNYFYDLTGFLHWGLNHYRSDQDPFEQSVVGHGGKNKLPPGDTHIVYPGSDGPWSSMRMEAMREGIEDYELLMALADKDRRAADRITRRVFRSFTDYTEDVPAFRRARAALLKASQQ